MDSSTRERIRQRISRKGRGELFFPVDFRDTGSSEAVRLALHRLEKDDFIRRVAQGIYVRPKVSKYAGEILPTAEEVAMGIAERDKIRLVPTGSYALHALGLSSQVPMKLVYLTDGSQREIKVGKRVIKLKRVTPKNLMAKGEVSSLVIQALREIGNGKLREEEHGKIVDLLKKEDVKTLKHDMDLAPEWIRKIMREALDGR